MQGNAVRKKCAEIGNAQMINQQFSKFKNARQQILNGSFERSISTFGSHLRIMVANHGYARRGRNANHFGAAKNLQEVLHHGQSLFLVAGVVVHLAATRLRGPKLDRMAQLFEDGDDRFTGLRKKSVVVAGDK